MEEIKKNWQKNMGAQAVKMQLQNYYLNLGCEHLEYQDAYISLALLKNQRHIISMFN